MKALILLFILSAVPALADLYRPIRFRLHDDKIIVPKSRCKEWFLGVCRRWEYWDEEQIVFRWETRHIQTAKNALSVVAGRFLDPRVNDCARKNTLRGFWYQAPYRIENWTHALNYIANQRRALEMQGFPVVNLVINNSSRYPNSWGESKIGNYVDARMTNGRPSVKGEYYIHVHRNLLERESAEVIAGAIGHQMLHQMTHEHRNGFNDNNYVMVFHSCLTFNGTYRNLFLTPERCTAWRYPAPATYATAMEETFEVALERDDASYYQSGAEQNYSNADGFYGSPVRTSSEPQMYSTDESHGDYYQSQELDGGQRTLPDAEDSRRFHPPF